MSDVPVLQTDRLILRPHASGDFTDCAALWADPEVVKHISGTPSTREETWSRVLRYVGHWQLLGYGYWVVQNRTTGKFLGEVGLADYQRTIEPSLDGKPEAGWVFATAAQGQGFAREAVIKLLHWADTSLGCDTTVCIIDPTHHSSISLARDMGYKEARTSQYHGEPINVYARSKPA